MMLIIWAITAAGAAASNMQEHGAWKDKVRRIGEASKPGPARKGESCSSAEISIMTVNVTSLAARSNQLYETGCTIIAMQEVRVPEHRKRAEAKRAAARATS